MVGALANLGHQLSDQTVGNILRRHGMAPAPKRSQTTTWKDFIRSHMDVLAGTDFFTVIWGLRPGRSRDRDCSRPPPQIRTCATNASGSHLG